ncbi:hypothetical protein I203_107767 [Kwoniella mangroviensis CBS 8507]|uniref:hypothetical protein n=1 Tax=Kwoniella mangroviensis CBS 8507 TaxID=1296122 RepID=UPI00080D84B5|nr:uncharacterized protein I203_08345 [Kwoniella mangroviensis CBS 8507]OCF62604.1 hypothetical protein I203_08345 [Kwoniella mangroviensis CBS 8507]
MSYYGYTGYSTDYDYQPTANDEMNDRPVDDWKVYTVGHLVDHRTVTQVNGRTQTEIFVVDKIMYHDLSELGEDDFQWASDESDPILNNTGISRITVMDPRQVPFVERIKSQMTNSLETSCQNISADPNIKFNHATHSSGDHQGFHNAAPQTGQFGSLVDCSKWTITERYESETNQTVKNRYDGNYLLRANQRYRASFRR